MGGTVLVSVLDLGWALELVDASAALVLRRRGTQP